MVNVCSHHLFVCAYTTELKHIQQIKWELALDCLQCFDAVGWAAGRASGL